MSEFFSQMGTMERILWYAAIPFSILLILQTLLTLFSGAGDELDADEEFDAEPDDAEGRIIGFRIFTVRNFIAFFTFFGWTGIVMLRSGKSEVAAILVALLAGLIAVMITGSFFLFITRMTEKGNVDFKNAIGKEGVVYLGIPAAMQGKGKLEVYFQSRFAYIDAMTEEGNAIRTGEKVLVTDVKNNILIVRSKGEN
jgi:hypothetical protein